MKLIKYLQGKLAEMRISLFRVGDQVTLVNDFGVVFHNHKIIEIEAEPTSYGGMFCLDTGSPWYPTRVRSIRIEKASSIIHGIAIRAAELCVPLNQKKVIYR
ncbi:hypothetical protein ICN48_06160 [Polynucleobacter sp. JS-Safj-400b-B2]|uniref:hypothetical protein n=1 Tax=Polynucleobacter sp. JS-Safj-400b-B2 TaxID=2576921 RepID=UPI001C0C7427|nr:hypothetical protein [Polynucleobacter sp. JS-Safj-400b-B2]MBU3625815.1 hypothetical protein [Polynucleobacter sp. JS-Safj-400b-B2]